MDLKLVVVMENILSESENSFVINEKDHLCNVQIAFLPCMAIGKRNCNKKRRSFGWCI